MTLLSTLEMLTKMLAIHPKIALKRAIFGCHWFYYRIDLLRESGGAGGN